MTPEHLPTEQYDAQLAEKVVRLQSMMTPFNAPVPEVFRSPVSHYRMRAEFRIWHDGDDLYHIIFDQQTKSRIRVDSFPAASELINQLMTLMMDGVRNNPVLRHKLFQIDYLTTQSNQAIVSLLYHKALNDEWREQAEALRDALRAQNINVHLIGRATKTKIMLDQDYIDERLPVAGKEMIYRQVENSFTQPNAAMNVQMLEWALKATEGSTGDLLNCTAATATSRWRWRVTSIACWQPKSPNRRWRPRSTTSPPTISTTCRLFVWRQKSLRRR
jgi:tRNA (uracil-5-)-methyltransferase